MPLSLSLPLPLPLPLLVLGRAPARTHARAAAATAAAAAAARALHPLHAPPPPPLPPRSLRRCVCCTASAAAAEEAVEDARAADEGEVDAVKPLRARGEERARKQEQRRKELEMDRERVRVYKEWHEATRLALRDFSQIVKEEQRLYELADQEELRRAQVEHKRHKEEQKEVLKLIAERRAERERLEREERERFKEEKFQRKEAYEALKSRARQEYLEALHATCDKWEETPDECRALRYHIPLEFVPAETRIHLFWEQRLPHRTTEEVREEEKGQEEQELAE